MRIALITPIGFLGGGERFMIELAVRLAAREHQVGLCVHQVLDPLGIGDHGLHGFGIDPLEHGTASRRMPAAANA